MYYIFRRKVLFFKLHFIETLNLDFDEYPEEPQIEC